LEWRGGEQLCDQKIKQDNRVGYSEEARVSNSAIGHGKKIELEKNPPSI